MSWAPDLWAIELRVFIWGAWFGSLFGASLMFVALMWAGRRERTGKR